MKVKKKKQNPNMAKKKKLKKRYENSFKFFSKLQLLV
jgi:hypothetical protein